MIVALVVHCHGPVGRGWRMFTNRARLVSEVRAMDKTRSETMKNGETLALIARGLANLSHCRRACFAVAVLTCFASASASDADDNYERPPIS